MPDGTTIPENVLIGVMSGAAQRTNGQRRHLAGLAPHAAARTRKHAGLPGAPHLPPLPLAQDRTRRGGGAAHCLTPRAGDCRWLRHRARTLCRWPKRASGILLALELAVAGLILGVGTFLAVALFKWMLLGRYRKCNTPMWTPFVWLSGSGHQHVRRHCRPQLPALPAWHALLPLALNLLGTRIATSAYLDTTDMTEFDCVQIGAHSELNALCCPQTHLFEDRVMKIDDVVIGAEVTCGPRCTVLYSATLAEGVQLGSLTLVMKGESLPAHSAWHGSPAGPWKHAA